MLLDSPASPRQCMSTWRLRGRGSSSPYSSCFTPSSGAGSVLTFLPDPLLSLSLAMFLTSLERTWAASSRQWRFGAFLSSSNVYAARLIVTIFPAGDIVYLNILGQDTIVLGSLKAARDLLDKRSANSSDRPTSVMVQLYVGRLLLRSRVLICRLGSDMSGSLS